MKFKINFEYKNIFNYIIIIIIILNLISIFYLYNFLRKNLYDAITYQVDPTIPSSILSKDNINIDKFNNVINRIENKQKPKDRPNVKNIFY